MKNGEGRLTKRSHVTARVAQQAGQLDIRAGMWFNVPSVNGVLLVKCFVAIEQCHNIGPAEGGTT